jgi:hypothetical protein
VHVGACDGMLVDIILEGKGFDIHKLWLNSRAITVFYSLDQVIFKLANLLSACLWKEELCEDFAEAKIMQNISTLELLCAIKKVLSMTYFSCQ